MLQKNPSPHKYRWLIAGALSASALLIGLTLVYFSLVGESKALLPLNLLTYSQGRSSLLFSPDSVVGVTIQNSEYRQSFTRTPPQKSWTPADQNRKIGQLLNFLATAKAAYSGRIGSDQSTRVEIIFENGTQWNLNWKHSQLGWENGPDQGMIFDLLDTEQDLFFWEGPKAFANHTFQLCEQRIQSISFGPNLIRTSQEIPEDWRSQYCQFKAENIFDPEKFSVDFSIYQQATVTFEDNTQYEIYYHAPTGFLYWSVGKEGPVRIMRTLELASALESLRTR